MATAMAARRWLRFAFMFCAPVTINNGIDSYRLLWHHVTCQVLFEGYVDTLTGSRPSFRRDLQMSGGRARARLLQYGAGDSRQPGHRVVRLLRRAAELAGSDRRSDAQAGERAAHARRALARARRKNICAGPRVARGD